MPSIKTARLENLPDGSPFTIPSLPDHFRLLYLVRGGQSTCKVQGYKRTETGGYTPTVDFFAPATSVVYDNTRIQLVASKEGVLSIPKEYIQKLSDETNQQEQKPNTKNKKAAKMKIEQITIDISGVSKNVGCVFQTGTDKPRNGNVRGDNHMKVIFGENVTENATKNNSREEMEDILSSTFNMRMHKNAVGRPKKYSITLPHDEEFTVSNVATKLGVKKFVINNEIARIRRETPNLLEVVGSLPQGKGKPARVFKLH